jgi:hypothetical protein
LPALQLVPLGQTMPQPPQFARSVVVLMHAPLHGEVPVGHVQVPPMQLAPEGHGLPHPPQLRLLVIVSTHDEPHCVSDAQPAVQLPALQTRPGSQMCPQVPQLEGSDDFSTHTPLQSLVPLGQMQLFAAQDAPVGHRRPHMPQFVVLVVKSTHAPPQDWRSPRHPQ